MLHPRQIQTLRFGHQPLKSREFPAPAKQPRRLTQTGLIELAREGDVGARARLLRAHAGELKRFVGQFVHDEADAHYLLEEIFTRCVDELERYEYRVEFEQWLKIIASETIAQYWDRLGEPEVAY